MTKRLLFSVFAFWLSSVPVAAQQQVVSSSASLPTAGVIDANGETLNMNVPLNIGFGSVGVEARGTFVGTVTVECMASRAGGAYAALILSPRDSASTVTEFTAPGQWSGSINGCQAVRARATAWTSGAVTITMSGSFAGGAGGGGASGAVTVTSGTITCTNCTGSGASNTEDNAFVNLDPLAPAGAVRKATPVNLSGADGDYEPLQISVGRLWTSATIDAALPAGTNNIGDVDVVSGTLTAVTTITNPVTITDGAGAVNVIIDSATLGTVTVASHAVTNAGTFATQVDGAALTSLQIIDNVVFGAGTEAAALRVTLATDSTGTLSVDDGGGVITVDGSISCSNCTGSGASAVDDAAFAVGTDSVAPAGALFDDAAPDSVNEGDSGLLRMSANRNLYSTIRDAAGNERGLNVDANGAIAAVVSDGTGALNVICDSGCAGGTQYAEDAAHASGNTGTLALVVRNDAGTALAADGDNIPLMVNSAGALYVATGTVTVTDGAGALNVILDSAPTLTVNAHAVTNAGTFATQIDGAALTSLQLTDNIVSVEDAVAGSAFSGVGFLAVRQDSHSDLAADGDFIPVTVDADGGLRVSIVAGAGSGGTALADDADFTAGTTSFTPVGGFYQSTVTACTDGDTCSAGITTGRAIKVAIANADGSLATYATDGTFDSAAPSAGPSVGFRVDTTTPTAMADGDLIQPWATTTGALYGASDQFEDVAETAGTPLAMVGTVRRDTAATSAGTTGDNATLNTDASGRLWVNCGTGCSGGTQYAEDLAHTTADSTFFVSGIRRDTTPSSSAATAGDYTALNIDANGRLYVNATMYDAAGAALTPATDVTEDAAETAGGTGPMVMSVRRDTAASSAGTTGDNATLNTDASGYLYATLRSALADDAAFTPATSYVNATGFTADEASPDSIDEGDIGAARMSLDRILYQRPGGSSAHYRTSAGSTEDEHEIKATAGILYSVLVTNTNAAVRYIRCYDLTAANTTPGTSTVFWGAAIPGATTGAGFAYTFPAGLTFSTALTCAWTTGAADTDVAEVAANEVKATYSYR